MHSRRRTGAHGTARRRTSTIHGDRLPATRHYAINGDITIGEGRIAWKAWGRPRSKPLSEIEQVRLVNEPLAVRADAVRFYCLVSFRDGTRLAFTNRSGAFGGQEDQWYRACVHDLLESLGPAAASRVDFVAGPKPGLGRLLPLAIMSIFYGALGVFLGWMMSSEPLSLLDAYGFVVWVSIESALVRWTYAEWVRWHLGARAQRRFAPDDIPGDLLP